jgi:phosphatidate phosphatase APP1
MGGIGNIYYFLTKKPYEEIRDLFQEIKLNEAVKSNATVFYYVSAAYSVTFDAGEWLHKNKFPEGKSFLKTLSNHAKTYEFKYATIKSLLQNEDPKDLHVLMFGDNSQVDQVVYSDLKKDLNLNADIYIRDVSTEATYFDSSLEVKKMSGVTYYFSEVELIQKPEFSFVSGKLKNKTFDSYKNKTLVPEYTLKTLEKRLRGLCQDSVSVCKSEASSNAEKYWLEYYSRY